MALVFLCEEEDAEDHAWVDGFDHVIHEPFVINIPGETLQIGAALLRDQLFLMGK